MLRVLVVEDERKTAAFIRKALEAEGFVVDWLARGDAVGPYLVTHVVDVIVLDIMLPGCDGLTLVRQLREQRCRVPVLLLTARGEVGDRVEGLNAGADDYLAKPFALAEMVARVRALARRGAESPATILRLADLSLDLVSHRVERGGRPIELTPREFRLLEFLLRSAGRVCARMEIVEQVWEYNFDPGTNLVDVYLMRLREKVDTGFGARLLHTVRGIGYVMKETIP